MAIKIGKIRIEYTPSQVAAKIKKATNQGIAIVMMEFIKDSNFYCRMDTGELIKSSLRASVPEKGFAVWDTPYARQVYYMGNPARDKNPNARLEWARVAKEKHKNKYERMLNKAAGGYYR